MEKPSSSPPSLFRRFAVGLLTAVIAALATVVLWTYVPLRVATAAGADEEVGLIFFLFGPAAGLIAGGVSGFLITVIRYQQRTWRRYLALLGIMLAVGVLLGAIFGDYRCAACF